MWKATRPPSPASPSLVLRPPAKPRGRKDDGGGASFLSPRRGRGAARNRPDLCRLAGSGEEEVGGGAVPGGVTAGEVRLRDGWIWPDDDRRWWEHPWMRRPVLWAMEAAVGGDGVTARRPAEAHATGAKASETAMAMEVMSVEAETCQRRF
uniref:Uncharacterized protein n=1 Tax=Oryza nivara TaxID=4536 RepID=A0A0E0FMB6_ORYNI